MKLDQSAIISAEKVRDYLLAPRSRNDKSGFFRRAGYTRERWERLAADLREQLLPAEATLSEISPYGDLYVIRGRLTGPDGVTLDVTTVWIAEGNSGQTRFVTAFPWRMERP